MRRRLCRGLLHFGNQIPRFGDDIRGGDGLWSLSRMARIGRFPALDYATEKQAGVRLRWYVMVTSASGDSVFATMGPYPTEADAEAAAEVGRVAHYRIGVARHGVARRLTRTA
jgi:hypothetical protein